MEETNELEVTPLIKQYLDIESPWKGPSKPKLDYLGDIVDAVIHLAFPPEPREEFPPGPHYLPLKVCVVGPPFSGKHTLAKHLEAKCTAKSFELETILEDRVKVLGLRPEDSKKKKQQEEESQVFSEECKNNEAETAQEKARLIRAKLRGVLGDEPKVEEEVKKSSKKEPKPQGWCLVGYPKSLEEAKSLELELSGFVHPSEKPEPIASFKKKEAEQIAEPSFKLDRPLPLEKSAFDIIFCLEASVETLVRRAVDRRVDNSGNVYNLTYNPPPDNLLPKLKPIEHPNEDEVREMFQEWCSISEGLLGWFGNFGVGEWKSLEVIPEMTIEELKERVDQKVEEWQNISKTEEEEEGEEPQEKEAPEEPQVIGFRDTSISMTETLAKSLYKVWSDLRRKYLEGLSKNLEGVDTMKALIEESIEQFLKSYQNFLCRPDDKQDLVDPLVEKLEYLVEKRALITKSSRKRIFEEIDELSDQLWDIIELRKEESLKHLENLKEKKENLEVLEQIIKLTRDMLQTELDFLFGCAELIKEFQNQVMQESLEIVKAPQLEVGESVEEVCKAAEEAAEYLPKQVCFGSLKSYFLVRQEQTRNWAKGVFEAVDARRKSMFPVMDDWIVDSVEAENKIVNDLVDSWKDSIKESKALEKTKLENNSRILESLRKIK